MSSRSDDYTKKNLIAVLDIKTTGLSHQDDCILEIGICELDLGMGTSRPLFDQIVREEHFSSQHESAWIFRNSSIKFEDVQKAKTLNSYKEELQKILNKYPVVAYNARFHFDFLINRGVMINELPCPMVSATEIIKIPSEEPNVEYKSPSVEEVWEFIHPTKKYIKLHRAFDDVMHESLIIYEMYKEGHWKPTKEEVS